MRKVERRVVPFRILLFIVSLIDRINIGFAPLEMNKELSGRGRRGALQTNRAAAARRHRLKLQPPARHDEN